MSKTNVAATRITLGGSGLDGYNGPVDIVTYRRTWWMRVLRMQARPVSVRRHVDVRGDQARSWRRS